VLEKEYYKTHADIEQAIKQSMKQGKVDALVHP
jgi:hypothetical protein